MEEQNLLIIHGGGPTAVLNASLCGAIDEAKKSGKIKHIYGAINGTGGVLREQFVELEKIEQDELQKLMQTPGSAIGTSRDAIEQEDYDKMLEIVQKYNISYVLFNGGNGTMDTCGKFYKNCKNKGVSVWVMGIPKTMDNDIAITDHSPGFGSAARYMAQSVQEVCADVQGLPIHVVIIEASGRNAGWITAASALAGENGGIGPDFIYLPERPFIEEQFLEDIRLRLQEKTGIVVVVSEGLKNEKGEPVVKPIFKTGRATYFGDVSSHLAGVIIEKLGYKARGEKPGLLGRSSIMLQSEVDKREAYLAGQVACRAVLEQESGKMVAFRRLDKENYEIETFLVDIDEVMLYERKMPDHFINEKGNGVTEEFLDWCRPLIGTELPKMVFFNRK